MATSGSEGSKTSLFGAVRRDADLVCMWDACASSSLHPPKGAHVPSRHHCQDNYSTNNRNTLHRASAPTFLCFSAAHSVPTLESGAGAPGLNTGSHINRGKWLPLHNSVSSSFTYE